MVTRRQFISYGAAIASTPYSQQAFALDESYEDAVGRIWQPINAPINNRLLLKRELVRYATLAPSSHNTQCWQFKIEDNAIILLADLTRRCPVVDPDDHHLFVSLGAATENLTQAALANGLQANLQFDGINTINFALEPTKPVTSPLYQAITERQCTRTEYDGKSLSVEELNMLEFAGTGDGVHILLHTEKQAMENILAYVVAGNSAQMHDPAFMAELKSWIRFSSSDAVRTGDGLYTAASGSPSVPKWIGSPLFNLMFNEKSENDKYAKHIRSSAGVAIFVSDKNDRAHWLEVGRCYERFALQATALGIRSAFLNQAVEVSTVRQQFARHLNIDEDTGAGRIDLVVRFGRGKLMPKSLRRPVEAVLI